MSTLRFLAVLAVFGGTVAFAATETANSEAETALLSEFSSYLQQLADDQHIETFAYAYFDSGETLVEIIRGDGVSDQSPIPLGTVSVVVNSLLIAAMEFQDELDCDRPIRGQLSGFRTSSEIHTKTMNLRHLLTMTSGLVEYADTLLPGSAQPEDVFLLVRQAPYAAPPGVLLQPNLTSPAAAGFIAASITDRRSSGSLAQDYRTSLTRFLTEPLGLQATDAPGTSRFLPATGIHSSLSDLRTMLQTELRDGMSPAGVRLISQVQAMDRRQPQRLADMTSTTCIGGWQRQAHLRTEYLVAASNDDTSVVAIAISPTFRCGWICLIQPGSPKARQLAEEAVLSSVELTRQLALLRDPSLLLPFDPIAAP